MHKEYENYLVITDVSVTEIMTTLPKGGIDWMKYGITPNSMRLVHNEEDACCGQGHTVQRSGTEKGADINIFPISNLPQLKKHFDAMEKYCEDSAIKTDKVEIVNCMEAKKRTASIVVQIIPKTDVELLTEQIKILVAKMS